MKVTLYHNCKLYCLNRDTLEFSEISDIGVIVTLKKGIAHYTKDNNERLIIVQAINQKKAAAKILTILMKE